MAFTPIENQIAGALRQSTALWGSSPYTVSGVLKTFTGIFNELSHVRAFEEGSGRVSTYMATIVSELTQFGGTYPVLGQRVTVWGQTFRIVKVLRDSISLTLHLDNTVK